MKKMLFILVIAVAALSCGKKCPCEPEALAPAFIGYNNTEIDTIIIKRFAKGSNFSQQLDSFALMTPGNSNFSFIHDTTAIYGRDVKAFSDDSDWMLINPFDNRAVQITDIVQEKTESRCGGIFGMDKQLLLCQVTSFKHNGVTRTLTSSEFHFIYIKK